MTKLKNNTLFRIIVIPICIALCLFGKFIPAPSGLNADAMGVLFIFLGVLVLWLTIGIDWPSLLLIFSLGFLDTIGFGKVFKDSFGNSTFIFLLFTFVCIYALSKTSLIKRIALGFISTKLAKKNGYFFTISLLLAVLFLGLFISPTVLFVMILPILEEIFKICKITKDDKISKFLMIGFGFTVSISSGMTPIAHVFPILAMNAANIEVSPLSYMAIGIPIGLMTFIFMLIILFIFIRPDIKKLTNLNVGDLKNDLPKLNKKDIITLIIFIIVILLWIVPSIFKDISPEFYNAINKYGTAMPAILGTLVLLIIRIDKEPLIKLDDAFKNGIPRSSLIMCAATLALGSALTSDAVGIKSFLETKLGSSLSNLPEILLLIIFGLWAIIQTNLSSNMVTATLVATVASSILISIKTSLNINAVICIIGMLASFAFATPPSMPHIAIIAGGEYANTKDVLIYGSMLMVVSLLCALLIGYPLGTLIL